MTDREKVIKGLELCEFGSDRQCYEQECPYYQKECTEGLQADILTMMKEQESLKQKMWNALYAEEDKLENHYIDTGEIDKWIVDYRPFLQRGFEIAIEVIAAHEEGR